MTKHANFNHDKSRRNALVLLASGVPTDSAGPGRCTVYDAKHCARICCGCEMLGRPARPIGPADAIHGYLTAVFDLVSWWTAEGRALDRALWALRLRRICPFDGEEPFAAIIRCTADPTKVDKRTRSKWSRALRYAMSRKPLDVEPLDQFIQRKGGINECVARLTQQMSWRSGKM